MPVQCVKASLDYDKAAQELICKFDRLAYAIDKGIPVLLESEARTLSFDDNNSTELGA